MITKEDHEMIAIAIRNVHRKLSLGVSEDVRARLDRLALMIAAIFSGEDGDFDTIQFLHVIKGSKE